VHDNGKSPKIFKYKDTIFIFMSYSDMGYGILALAVIIELSFYVLVYFFGKKIYKSLKKNSS
tara:strand:+ start:3558 stop:3743 length:186 start_codon:yes stop_codon:yes gene_type:complete